MDEFTRALETIAAAANKKYPKENGDYIKDGLLHCGKCNTPKQFLLEVDGYKAKVACMCQCRIDEQKKRDDLQREIDYKTYTDYLRNEAFPPALSKLKTYRFESANETEAVNILSKYADNFEEMRAKNIGIVLYGDIGTGKTYAEACLINRLVDKGIPCKFTSFLRFFNETQMQWDNRQEAIDALSEYQLLVIDDQNTEQSTETMEAFKLNVINTRLESGLPMIISTNMTENEMKSSNKRLFSRLFEACHFVEIKGKDIRKSDYTKRKDEIIEKLGLKEA